MNCLCHLALPHLSSSSHRRPRPTPRPSPRPQRGRAAGAELHGGAARAGGRRQPAAPHLEVPGLLVRQKGGGGAALLTGGGDLGSLLPVLGALEVLQHAVLSTAWLGQPPRLGRQRFGRTVLLRRPLCPLHRQLINFMARRRAAPGGAHEALGSRGEGASWVGVGGAGGARCAEQLQCAPPFPPSLHTIPCLRRTAPLQAAAGCRCQAPRRSTAPPAAHPWKQAPRRRSRAT